jgi:hypothetical protein
MARKSTTWRELLYKSLSPTRILLMVSVLMNIILAAMVVSLNNG